MTGNTYPDGTRRRNRSDAATRRWLTGAGRNIVAELVGELRDLDAADTVDVVVRIDVWRNTGWDEQVEEKHERRAIWVRPRKSDRW